MKILLWLTWQDPRGSFEGTLEHVASSCCMGVAKARRSLKWLGEQALVEYESTTAGYKIRVPWTKRFTWVPNEAIGAMLRLPDRACKTFLALCRMRPNASETVRVRLVHREDKEKLTLTKLIGLCKRAVQMALQDLIGARLVGVIRTGRSSIYCLRPDAPIDEVAPSVAPHSRHLVHLLRSTPPKVLSSILAVVRKTGKDLLVRAEAPVPSETVQTATLRSSLRRVVGDAAAAVLLVRYSASELWGALEMASGRRLRSPAAYLEAVIRRGWCT